MHVVPNMNPDGATRGYLRTNAGGATGSNQSGGVVIDFEEFLECSARCGKAKYGELKKVMTLAQGVRGGRWERAPQEGHAVAVRHCVRRRLCP